MDSHDLHQNKNPIRPSTDGMFRPARLPTAETTLPEPAEKPEALLEAPRPVKLLAKPRRRIGLWVILTMLLLTAAGGGVWFYLHSRHDATVPAKATTAGTSPSPVTPPEAAPVFTLAAEVTDPVLKEIQAKINSTFTGFGVEKGATEQAKTLRYHYPSDAFDIIAAAPDALGITARTAQTPEANQTILTAKTAIETILTAHKYVAVSVPTERDEGTYMTNGTRICELSFISGLSPSFISCANITDIDQQATKVRPFYVAMQQKNATSDVTSLYFNGITDSKTAGYQLATVGIGYSTGGSAGLFYQKAGGAWTFFVATQSALGCSMYLENSDVHAAYIGTKCSDANNNATTLN